jgi:beta-mannosidase
MQNIDLTGEWQFKAVDAYKTLPSHLRNVLQWMPANVPGTVHTDLLTNRKIPDPFYRMNEKEVQWVDSVQWVYKRDFNMPASLLEEDALYLIADGLDTYARITCNGRLLGETSNMFVEHRFDIRKHIHAGRNTLEICFDSPTHCSKSLEKKHGRLRVALEPHRVYIRKAQYSFSWDWGPNLTTSGIWRDISIQSFSEGKLHHPSVKVVSVNKRGAFIQISVDIERKTRKPLTLSMGVDGMGKECGRQVRVTSRYATIRVRVPNPRLWWPNGYGAQPMYTAFFSLSRNGNEIERLSVPFAIRTVRLIREKDQAGESFIIEVNGTKIFCKGADWIPSDSFLPRIPASTYGTLLRLAKDAHMNMIRVWGGGVYEPSLFYHICDRLGLMVWQDFMYACGEYPEEQWFLKLAKQEAEKAVLRLRNHPSIVIWCGNNECEWLFCTENPGKKPGDMRGAKIFQNILPEVCSRLDGTRPYWQSSPFGTGFPNDESNGNHHQWSVWSAWKDYSEYRNDNARFVTEFGFQAPANRKTMEEVTRPMDRFPQSPVMEHHNKQIEGTERLVRFQAAHHRLGGTFDDFVYKSQLVQAEALRCAVEHWRQRKFKTAGSLFWQLNDCWPVSSWSVVDSALRPKAAYFFAKRFFAPVLVSLRQVEAGVEVWVTSDLLHRKKVTISVFLRRLKGKEIWKQSKKLTMPANASAQGLFVPTPNLTHVDPAAHYLHAVVSLDGQVVSENRLFFVEPKHMPLPRGNVRVSLKAAGKAGFELTLRATTLIKNLRIEIQGEDAVLSDNYFDIDAGTSRVVLLESGKTRGEIRKRLRLHWLEK